MVSQVDWQSVREDVRQIQLAAGRAAELTHQLLAFARRDVVQPRPLDLNEVITRVEQLLIRTLGEHVILKTDLAPRLRAVLADPGQIEQVLVNLAVNARDAMPSGGTLVVQTSRHRCRRIPRGQPDRPAARPVRVHEDQRHRRGDAQGCHRPRVRAVLHHQAQGRGHRPRPGHRVRDRDPGRWLRADLFRTRHRHHGHHLAAGHRPRYPGRAGARAGARWRPGRDRADRRGRARHAGGDPQDPVPLRLQRHRRRQRPRGHRDRRGPYRTTSTCC